MSSGEQNHIGWAGAVAVHAGRLLRRWRRSPVTIGAALGVPVVMIVIIRGMFAGMVEQFSGAEMDMTGVAVMVGVSQAFTRGLLGAGAIVQERHEGLPQRLASMPGPRSAAIVGRILAEAARAFATTLAAVALGLVLGAEFGGAVHLLGVLVVLAFVAVSAGAVGVMLGHLVETPQGAFSFAPLVMVAMFFNTAMMPREMYAAVLRPLVDGSPITAVIELVDAIIGGGLEGQQLLVFVLWFGGLVALSLLALRRRASGLRRWVL